MNEEAPSGRRTLLTREISEVCGLHKYANLRGSHRPQHTISTKPLEYKWRPPSIFSVEGHRNIVKVLIDVHNILHLQSFSIPYISSIFLIILMDFISSNPGIIPISFFYYFL